MAKLCLYFQLHQPYRLRPFSVFEHKKKKSYFTDDKDQNRQVFQKVAKKSYVPMLSLLLELVHQHPHFAFALSCSGIFLEQAEEYQPEVIKLLKKLAKTGRVEFLAETYYHSLASLYSNEEFIAQVKQHQEKIWQLFRLQPSVFRNTELIYSNDIAQQVSDMGFRAMLSEAVERHLHGRARTHAFRSTSTPPLVLLLKHAQLSDDVAFRFSNKGWEEHPLTAEKYSHWIGSYYPDELVNLFMDFETFGEHQWEDTGIFAFFKKMVAQALRDGHHFVQPGAVARTELQKDSEKLAHLPTYDVHEPISWADIDRDLTAWRGNTLQYDALRLLYKLEAECKSEHDPQLLDTWRKLQTSDHFYYMCVKWSADGDVHKYFSPYDSPFEAYNRYTAVLADLQGYLLK